MNLIPLILQLNRFFKKLFRNNDMDILKFCHSVFNRPPSVLIAKRREVCKYINTVPMPWFVVYYMFFLVNQLSFCVYIYVGIFVCNVLVFFCVLCKSGRDGEDGLTSLLHDELHWLDVPERVSYKMGVMVYRCLRGQAPRYLADHLITSSHIASRLRLHAFRKPTPAHRTSLSSQHIRPSGVLDRWSDGLELAAWRSQRPGVWFWQF